jgi:hypothetical protein
MLDVTDFAARPATPAAYCGDDRNPVGNQLGRECRQPVIAAVGPTKFDRNVPPVDIAAFRQAPMEGLDQVSRLGRRATAEKSDDRSRGLLRPRRERPHPRRAAEQRDEFATPHGLPLWLGWAANLKLAAPLRLPYLSAHVVASAYLLAGLSSGSSRKTPADFRGCTSSTILARHIGGNRKVVQQGPREKFS